MTTEDKKDLPKQEDPERKPEPAEEAGGGSQSQVGVEVDGDRNITSTAGRDVKIVNNYFIGSDAQGKSHQLFKEGIRPEDRPVATEPIIPPDPEKVGDMTRWFRELKDPCRQYFVLLLSMFSGLTWFQFSAVHQSWIRSKKLIDEDAPPDPFGETDDDLLEAVCAERKWEEKRSAEIIKFKKPEYQGAILEMMRRSFRRQLDELVDYLRLLGENDDWEIRARASLAVAEISKKDFNLVRKNVFERWAYDDRPFVRAAVGYAAAKLILENVMADQVHQMLKEWGQSDSAWKRAWAAASACKQIGIEQPETAFRDLQVVAGYDDLRVTDAVIYALVVVSLEGHLDKVMDALKTWTEVSDQVVHITAVLAFWVMALGYAEHALDTAKAKAEGNPLEEDEIADLLQLLAASDVRRATAAGLLVRAFGFDLWELAFNVIAGWARQSAGNPALQNAASDITVAMYRELKPLRMGQVVSRLGQWEKDKDKDLAQFATLTKGRLKAAMLGDVESPLQRSSTSKSIVFGS